MAHANDPAAGHDVLFVMASKAELGGALSARIDPLICGIGVVEAGIRLTQHLAGLAAEASLPQLVVSLGSAGSARLQQGRVYQVASVSWRDLDVSALGFPRNQLPFSGQPAQIALPALLPGQPVATLSTGSDYVAGTVWADIAEDMADMETYAIARACQRFSVPLLGLRGVSDGSAELEQYRHWQEALPVIDRRLAEAVDHLAAVLEEQGLEGLGLAAKPAQKG